jgi:hypothetical protein
VRCHSFHSRRLWIVHRWKVTVNCLSILLYRPASLYKKSRLCQTMCKLHDCSRPSSVCGLPIGQWAELTLVWHAFNQWFCILLNLIHFLPPHGAYSALNVESLDFLDMCILQIWSFWQSLNSPGSTGVNHLAGIVDELESKHWVWEGILISCPSILYSFGIGIVIEIIDILFTEYIFSYLHIYFNTTH